MPIRTVFVNPSPGVVTMIFMRREGSDHDMRPGVDCSIMYRAISYYGDVVFVSLVTVWQKSIPVMTSSAPMPQPQLPLEQ